MAQEVQFPSQTTGFAHLRAVGITSDPLAGFIAAAHEEAAALAAS